MLVAMAGGASQVAGTETSILETPPYFIAALLSVFLVITLGFEKARCSLLAALLRPPYCRVIVRALQLLDWCKGRLERARKHGLVVRVLLANAASRNTCGGRQRLRTAESHEPHVQ